MSDDLRMITCCSCGVEFHISKALYDFRQRDKANFYCPNGHAQHFSGKAYTSQDYAKLEAERDSLLRKVEMLEAQLSEKEGKNKGWKLPMWKGSDER